jgi:hypothetical protein
MEQCMKVCKLCGIEKEYEKFPRHSSYADGYYSRCKECNYALEKKWRQNNQGKKREIRARYREANREKIREDDKKFYEENTDKRCQYQKNHKSENAYKWECYKVYNKAINNGELVRSKKCQICSSKKGKMDGHHHDYSKPLDVIWVCKECHMLIHAKINRAKRLNEMTPKGDVKVRSEEETFRERSEVVSPLSKDSQ